MIVSFISEFSVVAIVYVASQLCVCCNCFVQPLVTELAKLSQRASCPYVLELILILSYSKKIKACKTPSILLPPIKIIDARLIQIYTRERQ
jgi:hypothetical protein